MTPRPPAAGFHSRSERRSTRRAARRRKTINRLYRTAGPVVVLVFVVVTLLMFLGGPKSDSGAQTTVSTAAVEPVDESALLVIEQEETVPALVLVLPEKHAGLVLAMPGTTLTKTATGFKTLAELHISHQDKALVSALSEMLGESVGAVASVQWSQLRAALTQTGPVGPPPAQLEATGDGAVLAAGAVVALVGAGGPSSGAAVWDQLELGGDASGFRGAMRAMAPSISAGALTQAVLPGKLVEGVGFTYFEPDVEQVKALLTHTDTSPAITLEVENGSGVLGVAEQVGKLLEPLGYSLLPFRNSPDFPDVKRTRIVAATDSVGEAERVRARLGVATVEQDAALDSGHIVVVVGKDFVSPTSTTTVPPG